MSSRHGPSTRTSKVDHSIPGGGSPPGQKNSYKKLVERVLRVGHLVMVIYVVYLFTLRFGSPAEYNRFLAKVPEFALGYAMFVELNLIILLWHRR